MTSPRPLTQADLDHLKELVDLMVAAGVTKWESRFGDLWDIDPTIDLLIHYWAHLRAEGNLDVFTLDVLQPGATWDAQTPEANEMFYSYLDEVARGDHGNTA